jgi:hypothetical protein
MSKNIHGLERGIKSPIKRIVRQRCGFGCVKCGKMFIQYHHMPPYYSKTEAHDPNRITLLCPECHAMVPKRMSDKLVEKANSSPFCRRSMPTHKLLIEDDNFFIVVGNFVFLAKDGLLMEVEGNPLLSINYQDGIRLFSFSISNASGATFEIKENEVVADMDFWDVESSSDKITVRSASREIFLEMKIDADGEMLEINRLRTQVGDYSIDLNIDKAVAITFKDKTLIYGDRALIPVGQKLSLSDGGMQITGGGMMILSSLQSLNTDPKHLVRQLRRLKSK